MSIQNIHLEESAKTPLVKYFPKDQRLLIEGKLIPENPLLIFTELENWLDAYDQSDQQDLTVEFYLHYYNTSSLKRLNMFLKKINSLDNEHNKINIIWKCDDGDEDNVEDGEDFKEVMDLPFKIVIVEE